MIRTIALATALSLAAAAPFASTVEAGGHYKHKLCKATTLEGKSISFKCKIDEKCCYNKLLNEKNCGSKDGVLGLGTNMLCL
jgi:hypothetical protein